jgi:hypothetical protein
MALSKAQVFKNICPNSEAKREIFASIGHPNSLELITEDDHIVSIVPLSQLNIMGMHHLLQQVNCLEERQARFTWSPNSQKQDCQISKDWVGNGNRS